MRKVFKGYSKKTEEEIEQLWKEGLITFDTNVLLNLYRYSKQTSQAIINLIEKLSDKIFLTYHVGLEFNKHRLSEIIKLEKIYQGFKKSFIDIEEKLDNKSNHPFISEDLRTEVKLLFGKIIEESDNNELYYKELFKNDTIYSDLDRLMNDKIEVKFNETELIALYTKGEERYKDKIPPGYNDDGKPGNEKYGDLVIWEQIIKKAKSSKKPIIFITDDNKDDWWWKIEGRTIGPRMELINEIEKEASTDFHIYSSENFLQYGWTFLNEGSNQKVIDEVKDLQDLNEKTKMSDKTFDIDLLQRVYPFLLNQIKPNYLYDYSKYANRLKNALRDDHSNFDPFLKPEIIDYLLSLKNKIPSDQYQDELKRVLNVETNFQDDKLEIN